ncbi:MAG: phage holin family protein [Oscillospiraceae bacterium]|nr:phage holin family protein [Oscillospiraceae bacterium]
MDKIFNAISIIGGIVGGLCVNIFGGWDAMLWALAICMVLDYFSGIIKAVYNKELSSEIGFKGLLRKVAILIVVALSHVVQTFVGEKIPIREIVIVFYVVNEGISILENAAVVYPKTPEKLKEILLQLRGDNDDSIS